ncbi:MAG: DUF4011 domain-containing protein [Chloroflexi bacterium]|nr:DUF4011 domain-containing protein [Chloroflexota bacterium]
MVRDSLDAHFEEWEKELLDLSRRNPLIHCRPSQRLTVEYPDAATLYHGLVNDPRQSERGYTVYIPEPPGRAELDDSPSLAPTTTGHTDGQDSAERVATARTAPHAASRLSNGGARAPALSEIRFGDDRHTVVSRLYRLQRRARTAEQEYGVNALFMGFGILEWWERPDSEPCTSPLLLLSVSLERDNAFAPYRIRSRDDRPSLNPALARLLERQFQIALTLPSDEEDRDLALGDLLEHVRRALDPLRAKEVKAQAYLGFFSFHKLTMYEDLRRQRARFQAHRVIRAVAGVDPVQVRLPEALQEQRSLDDWLSPEDVYQVLDADASQQAALVAIRHGASLVIQGPPGTGKSQTIANAIAEAMALGKTVLFVSEKMAALEVVAKRLREVGLGEFILEVHSDKADKKRIVQELFGALQSAKRVPTDHVLSELERLRQRREQLNAYVRALHDRSNPLGRSAYWIHGELARLHNAPNIPFECPDVATLTPRRLERLRTIVKDLASVGQALQAGEQHPWYGCRVQRADPHVRSRVEDWLTRLRGCAERLENAQDALRSEWGLPAGKSLADAEWLAQLLELLEAREPVPPHWLTAPSLESYQSTTRQWEERLAAYYQQRRLLEEVYDQRLFNRDLAWLQKGLTGLDELPPRLLSGDGPLSERALVHRRLLEDALPRFIDALQELVEETGPLADVLGLDATPTLAGARHLLAIGRLVVLDPRPMDAWLDVQCLTALEALAEEAGRRQETISQLRPGLEECFDGRFFELADGELGETFERKYASWFRWLRPSYHHDMGRLRQTTKRPVDLDYRRAATAFDQARRVLAAERWLAEHGDELAAAFGHHYQGARTQWDAVQQALHTTRELLAQFEHGPLPPALVARLRHREIAASVQPRVDALAAAVEAVEQLHRALTAHVALEGLLGRGRTWDRVPCLELRQYLEAWHAALRHLWQAVDDLRGLRRQGADLPTLRDDIARAIAVQQLEADMAAAERELRQQFGALYTGLATDWPRVHRALEWTARLRQHLGGAAPEGFVRAFAAEPPPTMAARPELTVARQGLAHALQETRDWFEAPRADPAVETWPQRPLGDLAGWATAQQGQLPRLDEWVVLQHALREAEAEGLAPFVEAVRPPTYPPECWEDAFCRQVYSRWLAWRYEQAPELARFHRDTHERVLQEFRDLDRQQLKLAAQRIVSRLLERRPRPGLEVHPQSEPGLLQREASKQRRLWPLRRLFARIPTLLPALKPCLLMSPLSVAQYLGEIDPPIEFDLVLFDEASQILPADAIGAIGRAKQVVVMGDDKQLPPTRFFMVSTLDEPMTELEDEAPPESILEACQRVLPKQMLEWHYRSRHEALIACSNRWFYNNKLITFPSPAADDRAVEFIYVPDGVYDRGGRQTNRQEARRVVELIIEHVTREPDRSLGVITFSEAQMEEITRQLNDYRRRQPELEPLLREDGSEGFFVKNLENVQGDERDVIILSVGYGRDASGRLLMNFGPLTQQGGERRLNVAITRARERVKVVASFRPEEIDLSRVAESRREEGGLVRLRQYLEFAEKGPAALLAPLTSEGGHPESPFEVAVADALHARGLTVVSQVGVGPYRIDLAIKDEVTGRYLLGIECDGATYHSAPTARDRDRLRQEVLERLGWRIHRIWSTNWLKDPEGEVQRVLAALEQARQAPQIGAVRSPSSARRLEQAAPDLAEDACSLPTARSTASRDAIGAPPVESDRLSNARTEPAVVRPYVKVELPAQGGPVDLRQASPEHLAALIHRCVQAEGPVHEDRVFEVIARSYQAYLTREVRRVLRRAVTAAARRGLVEQRGPFLWPPGMQAPPVRGATASGEVRFITCVPPEEIAEACRIALRDQFSLPHEALVQTVATVFGYQRAGKNIRDAIQAAIRHLVERGDLREVGGQLSLNEPRAG